MKKIILMLILISGISHADNTILNKCKIKWGTDYSMVKYCVNKQTQAKNSIPRANSTILNNCKTKWGTDYSMVKYCVDKQNKAKRELGL